MKTRVLLTLLLILMAAGLPSPASGQTMGGQVNWFNGPKPHWPTNWAPIPSLNDPLDSGIPGQVDIIGDAQDQAVYYAADKDYIYFRVRVHVAAVYSPTVVLSSTIPYSTTNWTFDDHIGVFIDNVGDAMPAWAFSWDTHARPYREHALELKYRNDGQSGPTWAIVQTNDVDHDEHFKIAPPDFGWGAPDGYLRTIDQQPTANFGATTFVDYAARWSFLAAQTAFTSTLAPGQTWRIQVVSAAAKNDHDVPNSDVAGGFNPSDPVNLNTWSAPVVVNQSLPRIWLPVVLRG